MSSLQRRLSCCILLPSIFCPLRGRIAINLKGIRDLSFLTSPLSCHHHGVLHTQNAMISVHAKPSSTTLHWLQVLANAIDAFKEDFILAQQRGAALESEISQFFPRSNGETNNIYCVCSQRSATSPYIATVRLTTVLFYMRARKISQLSLIWFMFKVRLCASTSTIGRTVISYFLSRVSNFYMQAPIISFTLVQLTSQKHQ